MFSISSFLGLNHEIRQGFQWYHHNNLRVSLSSRRIALGNSGHKVLKLIKNWVFLVSLVGIVSIAEILLMCIARQNLWLGVGCLRSQKRILVRGDHARYTVLEFLLGKWAVLNNIRRSVCLGLVDLHWFKLGLMQIIMRLGIICVSIDCTMWVRNISERVRSIQLALITLRKLVGALHGNKLSLLWHLVGHLLGVICLMNDWHTRNHSVSVQICLIKLHQMLCFVEWQWELNFNIFVYISSYKLWYKYKKVN